MENKEFKYVKFLPWVSEYYKEGEGFQGNKILVLGDSHYCAKYENRNDKCRSKGDCSYECMNDNCHKMTRDLIRREYMEYRSGRTKSARHLQTILTFDWDSRDPLFDEIAAYARGQKRLTTSGISDKFCIGFNRANRIIRQIEESGVLTTKARNDERVQD